MVGFQTLAHAKAYVVEANRTPPALPVSLGEGYVVEANRTPPALPVSLGEGYVVEANRTVPSKKYWKCCSN